MRRRFWRALAIILILCLGILLYSRAPKIDKSINHDTWKTNYTYVFVHGLSGWGSYDTRYKFMPYWGMFGGDNIKYFNKQGFTTAAASVDPHGSAWDRVCELYAQLTGTKVDYGEAHSKAMGHDRYGEDYTDRALIEKWDAENKINLVGHSFGGVTVRLLAELMANGDEAEVKASGDNTSPLFTGGKADWIYSITTLAAPTNGTTAYDLADAIDPEPSTGFTARIEAALSKAMGSANSDDDFIENDCAAYDMNIDNAKIINDRIETLENVYYFSIPCCSTTDSGKGYQRINTDITDMMFRASGRLMGAYTYTTKGGIKIDKKWLPNDGLVNTYSARAPFDAPQKDLDTVHVEKGIWQVYPTFEGDHMSIIGGLFKTVNVKSYYTDFMCLINEQ